MEFFSPHSGPHGQRFEIKVSAQMEQSAKSTLRLIAFYRPLKNELLEALDDYCYCCWTAVAAKPSTARSLAALKPADNEVQLMALESWKALRDDKILSTRLDEKKP